MIKRARYVRIGKFNIEEVLPYVFTRKIRHQLKEKGASYRSREWAAASCHSYPVVVNDKGTRIIVAMGSHRYQLFAEKGIACVSCGICGEFFALERGSKGNPDKYHFNLYGRASDGKEIMITKDHIKPRSQGGRNRLTNYQPMCYNCNSRKSNKFPDIMNTEHSDHR